MNRTRLVTKLLFNGVRYRLLKATGQPARLEAISLEITHRCICRCHMCNIWKIPPSVVDLPVSKWTELLSSPALRGLRELDITGGEPFLHPDLAALINWICQAKTRFFPDLKTVAITTNGILSKRVLKTVGDVLGPLQQQGIDLVLACGLDAVGPLHDKIRNFPGAWDKLVETLDGLKPLALNHPNLILGIKTTIIPANLSELERIVDFAREQELFTIISPCIITANRFGNLDLQDDLCFRPDDLRRMKAFFSNLDHAWSPHRQTLLRYLQSGKVNKPCSAGFNTLFIRHNGDVFPCPVIPHPLGNISQNKLETLLAGLGARRFRHQIGRFAECQTCTEPGLERIAWPYEGFTCLGCLAQLGFAKFEYLIRHMGLNKYL